jgi:hypothetical protein
VKPAADEQLHHNRPIQRFGQRLSAAFVFVFSFPCILIGERAKDMDMANFPLVKTVPRTAPRFQAMPSWEPNTDKF